MQLVLTIRLAFISLVILTLSACGGGGNSSSPSPSPSPISTPSSSAISSSTSSEISSSISSETSSAISSSSTTLLVTQNFTFYQIAPFNLLAGDVLSNQATGEGSGTVIYISSNPAVATVGENGLVNVVGAGDTIITANKAADSKYLAASASYTIHATSLEQTLSFTQSGSIDLFVGDTLANPARGQGSGDIIYYSGNPEVATVDSNGLVTVFSAGTALIAAFKAADPYYYAAETYYIVEASAKNQTLGFSQPGPFSVIRGANLNNPALGQATGPVIYSSSNLDIATVDSSGQVNVVGAGKATITAAIAGDRRYLSATNSYLINSQALDLSNAGPIRGFVGTDLTNQATGQGSGALTYSSSNPTVASVSSDGRVTLLSEGSAVITASKAADVDYLAASINYVVDVARNSQIVTFTKSDVINLSIGDTLANPATAQGTGALTYSSSDTSVAKVDSEGVVTVTAVGSAIITATKAADVRYLSATASYTINIKIPFTAWVGRNDALVNFPTAATGLEFYRSSNKDCDFANYLSCANGQMNLLTGSSITDSAAQFKRPGYYLLKNGNKQTAVTLQIDVDDQLNGIYTPFKSSAQAEAIVFKNKIWVVSSYTYNDIKTYQYINDIWSSSDGLTWTQEVANTPFAYRSDPKLVVFNNKLWLLGGLSQEVNDVWSSVDGTHWTKETDDAKAPLTYRKFVVYKDKIWGVGGLGTSDLGIGNQWPQNDVWSTPDGITWTRETARANFPARSNHALVVFNDQMWLVSGHGARYYNDVWSSTDGITWVEQTTNAGFSARALSQLTVFDNKLWLIGGSSNTNSGTTNLNDVWSSPDGIIWTQQSAQTPFSPRLRHGLINFKDQLMLLGGSTFNPKINYDANDAWISTDGIEWRVGYRGNFIFSQ